MKRLPACGFLAIALCAATTAAQQPLSFATLTPATPLEHGFKAEAVYLNAAGQPFGARFRHVKSGFTLDLIELQTVPQAFVYATTFPVSDKGEPHTQEHLLVTKGNQGRMFGASESMTLTESTAFTMQWRTCYPFQTLAGPDVLYQELELELKTLLHPDYTDEEIRREVRNFGVIEGAKGTLSLEEKGSVYNEMVSSANDAGSRLFRLLNQDVYGTHHPLSYDSGGEPSGIREMTPQDIRTFHRDHYFLGNMAAIVSLPKGESLDDRLSRLDAILNRVQPSPVHHTVETEATLPPPSPAPAGEVSVVDFPFQNDQQPGYLALAWPANRKLTNRDLMLFNIFADSFAGEPGTNLYELFVNSKTRKMDLGATGVFSFVSEDEGFPYFIGLAHVSAPNLTREKAQQARALVVKELARVAAWPDGSPELAAFNDRARGRLIDLRRQMSKLVNTPPGFGFRNGYSGWMEHLHRLNREPGFRKTVTMDDDTRAVEQMLAGSKNVWREALASWHLTDTTPYAAAARPSPALLEQERNERQQRVDAEVKRLEAKYGATDPQQAIRKYEAEYDAQTAALDKLAAGASAGEFVKNPPLTLDDQLEYRVEKLPGDVPLVASTFDNMTGATAGLMLRLDGVPENDLELLSVLPELLTQSGVVVDGRPVPYEQMTERLRKEVLGLRAAFDTNVRTGRIELQIEGSGNDLGESRRAVEWMQRVLEDPYWSAANLPRLRDVVEQLVARLRSTEQNAPEYWVMNPAFAYERQRDPLFLVTASFLTRADCADRVRWMLEDAGSAEDRSAAEQFLAALGEAAVHGSRDALKAMLTDTPKGAGTLGARYAALTPVAQKVAGDAMTDLGQLLPDLPDRTLRTDWKRLSDRMIAGLEIGPQQTLMHLNLLRESLLRAGNARMYLAGSRVNQAQLDAPLRTLAGALIPGTSGKARYRSVDRVTANLKEHQGDTAQPRFVGLLDANMQGGVMFNMMPCASYGDTDRERLLDLLTVKLFDGHGAHTLYAKTTGVGLAYSNGIRTSIRDGWIGYYAERMPEIPQTLHFAIDVVKHGSRDPRLSEYAVARVFSESHAAETYEQRAKEIADDLADGITPDKVRRFREAILALRREAGLSAELFRRIDAQYGRILPGYGVKAKDTPGVTYYIIGPEKQFAAFDADVQRQDEHVYRLYPRDYWFSDQLKH